MQEPHFHVALRPAAEATGSLYRLLYTIYKKRQ